MKKFIIILIVILMGVVGCTRVLHYNSHMHTYHHEKAEIINVIDCYEGSFSVCKIEVEFNNKVTKYEIRNANVDTGDPLYKHCFYRGEGFENRRCYTNFKSTLSSKHSPSYQDIKNDVLNK